MTQDKHFFPGGRIKKVRGREREGNFFGIATLHTRAQGGEWGGSGEKFLLREEGAFSAGRDGEKKRKKKTYFIFWEKEGATCREGGVVEESFVCKYVPYYRVDPTSFFSTITTW